MWWDTHLINWNGKSLLKKEVDMIIDSNASLTRLGSNQSEPKDRRSVVTDRVQNAHQLSGAAGYKTSSQDIPEKQNQDVTIIWSC